MNLLGIDKGRWERGKKNSLSTSKSNKEKEKGTCDTRYPGEKRMLLNDIESLKI